MLLASEVELGTYQVQGLESRPLVIRLLEFELDILKDGESLVTLGTRPTFLLRDGVWAILVHIFFVIPYSLVLKGSVDTCPPLGGGGLGARDGGREGSRDPTSDVERVHCSAVHVIKVEPSAGPLRWCRS